MDIEEMLLSITESAENNTDPYSIKCEICGREVKSHYEPIKDHPVFCTECFVKKIWVENGVPEGLCDKIIRHRRKKKRRK
ncbi:MAG: hypothetical protein ACI4XJ_10050 [Eubacteriales bacterium]